MPTHPTPGGDINTWGPELQAWNLYGHNPDGSTKTPQFIDIRDFDVDPTGNNDSAAGINLALQQQLTGGGKLPVVLQPNGTSRAFYALDSSIIVPQHGWLVGQGQRGYATELRMESTNLAAHAITTADDPHSAVVMQNLRVVDMRTDPARTGNGIHLNRQRDYVIITDCMVQKFQDNYYVGTAEASLVGDRVAIDRCWSVNPTRYGIHAQQVFNTLSIRSCWIDMVGNTTDPTQPVGNSAIFIEGGGQFSLATVDNISVENYDGSHVLRTDGSPVFASNLTATIGSKGTGDIVRIDSGYGQYTTLVNISGRSTAIGSTSNAYANLLNLVERGWTIPNSERFIHFWTGYASGSSAAPGGVRIGKAKIVYSDNAAGPENVVVAEPGSLALCVNGKVYKKNSGVAATGWLEIT